MTPENNFDLPTFLEGTAPVTLLTHLESFRLDGSTLWLECGTQKTPVVQAEYYGTRCETVFDPPQPAPPAAIRIQFLGPDLLRISLIADQDSFEEHTPMVIRTEDTLIEPSLSESTETLELTTAAIRLVVQKEPWQLRITSLEGVPVWHTRPVDIPALRRPAEQWNPPQQRWLFLHRYAYPWGWREKDGECSFASFGLAHDEHIYGLGEDFGPVDKRGRDRQLWLQEGFGNASPAAYKQTPFYLSSKGYGIFLNTSNRVTIKAGSLEHTALSTITHDTINQDLFWFYGPELPKVLGHYTDLTGEPRVPPLWSFGLWMGRITYNSQDQVESVARELRQREIPCDVIHIDTGWYQKDWECDFEFGKQKFPDPKSMFTQLRKQGFRASLWQWPNLTVGSALFSEAQEKGLLAKRPNGQAYTYPGFLADAGLIDYSNPDAVSWIKEKISRLFDLGVSAIKVDFGEGAPPDALYQDVPGAAMHNRYPLLYSQAIHEVSLEKIGEEEAVSWTRAGWAGSQRYPVHWSGDGVARWEDLACVLRSALSMGYSGFPFYSHDIGGFSGLPSPELYIRWAQLGLFFSHARCHGEPPREPWAYGKDAERIFREIASLRYRLMPYIYSEARKCGQTSLPMVRAMQLAFESDPGCVGLEDQYMFGDHLLVAPILDPTSQRQVYFPPGDWVDYWSKDIIKGPGHKQIISPLDQIPIYIQAGALIPFGPALQHLSSPTLEPLRMELYAPLSAGTYAVQYPGLPEIKLEYTLDNDQLLVQAGNHPGRGTLALYGPTVQSATVNGQQAKPTRTTGPGSLIEYQVSGDLKLAAAIKNQD